MKTTTAAIAGLLASAAGIASAAPSKTQTAPHTPAKSPAPSSSGHPCAQISALWTKQHKNNADVYVPAELAYSCFQTVPLGKKEALDLVDAIQPYLEWQSDAAYKKNPPKDYFYPGFDMFANLATVRANVAAGKYASEYDFQVDLYKQVWAPGQDGHYLVYTDLLSRAFLWSRPDLPLVSVSDDGISLPQIKLKDEVVAKGKAAQTISKINDIDAAKFLEDTANSASYVQDVDAAYNNMFWSKASAAFKGEGNFVKGGRFSKFYPGPTTSVTFANGTKVELPNRAAVVGDMTGVVDGPSMYKKFCTPVDPADGDDATSILENGSVPGYPKPFITSSDGVITGYYLTGEGLSDVAVLAVPSFNPKGGPAEFQSVTSDFLREAKAAGKTKLVIDLQNNAGGMILLGYDMFRQLFPKTNQGGNSRFKLNKGFADMAKAVSDVGASDDPAVLLNDGVNVLVNSWFNYRSDMNLTNQNFLTFQDKFTPHVYEDTSYTNLMRWNLSDPFMTSDPQYGLGIEISGYGSRTNLPEYFKPEDIVLLYDGSCSSTCTTFSEFLREKAGVKSVVVGGRPKAGAMQAVGGVKGSQVLSYRIINIYAQAIAGLTDDAKVKADLARYSDLPIKRSVVSVINARDAVLDAHVNDGIPSQYVYQAADCRLFWTAPMISDVSEVWKAAANAAFNGAKCAYGAIAGSKPGRRSEAPAVAAGPRLARQSDKVDKTSINRDLHWKEAHVQRIYE